MIGFHAFAGSDVSGRFAGRSKDWCFKVFLKCDSKILDAVGALGQESEPSPDVCAQLERFVCLIYKSEKYLRMSKIFGGSCFQIVLLRKRVFHLPLVHYSYTYGGLTTSRWYGEEQKRATLPSPAAYDWELLAEEGIYTAIRCVNPSPPSSEAVTILVRCGCQKGVQDCIVVVRTIYHVQRCVVASVIVATTDITP